ncbi:hypothetical protein BH09ACT7_BH09ACT7_58770 [soil metagenome]
MSATRAVLAHGLGGSTDLPIPYNYALIGASWALTISFAVVALAWKRPRFDPDNPARPLPAPLARAIDAQLTHRIVAALGILFAAWALVVSWFGPQGGENTLPATVYVLLWVGLGCGVGGDGTDLATMLVMVAYTFTGLHLLFGG